MPWRRSRRPTSEASACTISASLIGGGEPRTSGRDPAMCPRACAFGPRTSPTTRSGSPRCARSQSTSTTAGRSDTRQELREHGVELVRPLQARQVAGVEGLRLDAKRRLLLRDERIFAARGEENRPFETSDHLPRVAPVADRLHRGGQLVGPLLEGEPTRERDRLGVARREELRAHELPQRLGAARPDELEETG